MGNAQLARIYEVWEDLDATLDCLPPLFVLLTAFGKSAVGLCKEQEVRFRIKFFFVYFTMK